MNHWYQLSVEEVLDHFGSSATDGLRMGQVVRKRAEYGPNAVTARPSRGSARLFWEQIGGPLGVLLILAIGVSLALRDYHGAALIGVIMMLNVILGFWQQKRSEHALGELRKFTTATIRVRRDRHVRQITSRELVPGDIVLLESGNVVPADCRIGHAVNLRVKETVLTGEATPAIKRVASIPRQRVPLAEQTNMLFMGTEISHGRGWGIVTETGMSTELGQVVGQSQAVCHEPTPLQQRLSLLAKQLTVAAIGLVVLIVLQGIYLGTSPLLLLQTAISMAVAVVPEALPAVTTLTLALHARRMLRSRALIRKLPAVELLGSITAICSEKTGALTRNQMSVVMLDLIPRRFRVAIPQPRSIDSQQAAADSILPQDESLFEAGTNDAIRSPSSEPWVPTTPADWYLTAPYADATRLVYDPVAALLVIGSVLCNDAIWDQDHEGQWRAIGDPTEKALAESAARLGWMKSELEETSPRVTELPFEASRKRMTTVHEWPDDSTELSRHFRQTLSQSGLIASPEVTASQVSDQAWQLVVTKGAVETVLETCNELWMDQQRQALDATWRARIVMRQDELAAAGMRVLGVAWKAIPREPERLAPQLEGEAASKLEQGLIFTGMLALIDPPRPEAYEALTRCRAAGIRPILVTGDHPRTAESIARQLGIDVSQSPILGNQLAETSTEELRPLVSATSVFARVTPEQKVRIVQALQDQGQIVSVMGDGVTDTLALKTADVGVAMGLTGSDVASESAELILLDDNFATMVTAIAEGRVVHDNIKKFVKYLLISNMGEMGVMLIGPLCGMPLPLSPSQILWINLVTDGLPALSFAMEPAEQDVMHRSPDRAHEKLLNRSMLSDVGWMGMCIAAIALLAAFVPGLIGSHEPLTGHRSQLGLERSDWQTMLFLVLTLTQLGGALALRSTSSSIFRLGFRTNPFLLIAVGVTFVMQMVAIYVPLFQALLGTVPLTATQLLIGLLLSTLLFWAIELKKWWQRRASSFSIPSTQVHPSNT